MRSAGFHSLSWLDVAVPALFAAVLVAVGFIRSKRGSSIGEFLTMSRAITAPAFVMSLVSAWYGGILGVSEYSYNYGLSNWFVFGVPYYLYALIFAIFLARRARRTQIFSIPERLESSYGAPAGRVAALIIFLTTMPAAYFLMLGKLTSWMFGWEYPIALGVSVLISTVFIYSGGLRSVVRTETMQFVVMYAGFIMIVVVLISNYGGWSFIKSHVPAESLTPTGGQGIAAILVWYFIASTTLIEPLFYERAAAAKSEKIVLPGIIVCILLWMLFDFMTTTTGLYARALLTDLPDPAYAFPELAAKVLPAGLFGLFFAALLATVISTVDAYAFIAASAFGRDLIWKSRAGVKNEKDIPRFVRWGLLATTICAGALALASDSIVALWHAVGSVSAPALLIPVLSSWSLKYSFNKKFAMPAMIFSGGIALIWQLSNFWTLDGKYWFGVEPIYVGLSASLLLYLLGILASRPHRSD